MKLDKKHQHQLKLCISTRCNFCRRACPIYEVSGMEFDSPRAWLEVINEAIEGRVDSLEIMSLLNKCTLCRKCVGACPHGIETPEIILDFKSRIRGEYIPEPIEILDKKGEIEVDREYRIKVAYPWIYVKNFILNANPLGEKPKKEGLIADADFVFFPGCITNYKDKEVYEACVKFFKKVGAKYSVINACCYSELKPLGFSVDEIRRLFEKRHPHLRGMKIVTPCAGCYHTLKEDHKLNVMHISELIYQHKNKIKRGIEGEVTLHDPCKLGRYHGKFQQSREIIQQTGAKLVELRQNKKESHCCGGGGSLKYYYPQMQENVCENLIKLNEKKATIVTNCSYCKQTINKNTKQKAKHLIELI